jgi:hypothetical protein
VIPILVQDALRAGEQTLDSLAANFGIRANRSEKHPGLVQLKYDMINSPLAHPLVQQCRGLILDESNSWAVVARPFDKFFNYGEQCASAIHWGTAQVQEKVDGSLMILYYYGGKWNVATSGMPDASGDVNGFAMTFGDLFWDTFRALDMDLPPSEAYSEFTFMFELTSPQNRIVVRQEKANLTFLEARKLSGYYADAETLTCLAATHNWNSVKVHSLKTLDDVLATFATIDPLTSEGYVIKDNSGARIKVKHPGYVAIHHMRGEGALTPKRVLDVVLKGEAEEVLANFPEWQPAFDQVMERLLALTKELVEAYERIKDLQPQKTFALEAVKVRYSAALFQLRAGKVYSIREALLGTRLETLVELLELKEIKL